MHTLCQLPAGAYALRGGSKTEKALHLLCFHPDDGFVAWVHHLAGRYDLRDEDGLRKREQLRDDAAGRALPAIRDERRHRCQRTHSEHEECNHVVRR